MHSAYRTACVVVMLLLAATCGYALADAQGRNRGEVRMLVQRSPLAGLRYGEAAGVWDRLRLGDELELSREPDNPFDANAIRVDWRGRKLGYVPRRDNAALSWAMDRGEALRARISGLAQRSRTSHRVELEVYME